MCLLINDVVLKKNPGAVLSGSDKDILSSYFSCTNLKALTHYLRKKRDTVKMLVEAPVGCISNSSCVNDGSFQLMQTNVQSSLLKNDHQYIGEI